MFSINKVQGEEAETAAPVDPRGRWLRRETVRQWSSHRLLARVLGPGRPAADELASRLLETWGAVEEMARLHPAALAHSAGLGPARTERLLAALELGRRVASPAPPQRLTVRRPEDLHPLLGGEFAGLDRERFLALYLDTRHRVVALDTVSVGTLNASLVHPREVFRNAVAMGSAAVIVAHNHPSGCARPSGDDLELTARLDRCGDLLGIALLDHLVAGGDEIVSIREHGWPRTAPAVAGS